MNEHPKQRTAPLVAEVFKQSSPISDENVASARLEAFERGWTAATDFYALAPDTESEKDEHEAKRAEWKEKAWKWMLVSPLLTAAFTVLWKPDDPEDDGPEYCAKRDELAKAIMTILFGEKDK